MFRCADDLEPHPVRTLELARRNIVRGWAFDAPILSVPLVIINIKERCIWLFAAGERNGASKAMLIASFEGLVGELQI